MSFLIIIVYFINYVQSAKILGVFQFPSLSHQIVYQTLWRELSLRGHEVIVVTPYPLKDKSLTNLTEIDVSYIQNMIPSSEAIEKTMSKEAPTTDIMRSFYSLSEKIQDLILENSDFKTIYNSPNVEFDLIIVECLHPGMYSLSGKFKAPIVGISSLGIVVASHESIGNTNHPILYPDMNLAVHENLTIKEKIYSIYFSIWLSYYYKNNVIINADRIARKHLGNNIPYLGELAGNVSLIFVNTNPVIYNVRPNIPTIIELGQMHIKPPGPLPKNIQTILDETKEGVVYFSLGSNVKSINLHENLKKIILQALSELPYKFLWKWETENLPGNTKNIIIGEWFPQQDILAHPNIKGFITQGGLQSIEEAICRGVPMIGMPFIGDQPMNVKKIVKAGIAVEVNPLTVSKEQLKEAIIEIVENEIYRKKIKEIQYILNDQPMTGLERAVWWTEYIIRHKGAKHLRSPTADISCVQYLLLDIMGVLLIVFLILLYILKRIFYLISFAIYRI